MSDNKKVWLFEHEQGIQRRLVYHATQVSALREAVDFLIDCWARVERRHRPALKALLSAGDLCGAVEYCAQERVFGNQEVIQVRSRLLLDLEVAVFARDTALRDRIAALPVPQQTYDVTVRRTRTCYASVTVVASSEAEARQAARKLAALSAEWGEEDPELDASDTRCVLLKEET